MLKVGDKLDIIVNNNIDYYCYSMVQDVYSEDEMLITMPMDGTKLVLVGINEDIQVVFYRDEGQFVFDALVLSRNKVDNIFVIHIRKTSDFKRIQRRSYFRLKVTMPLNFELKSGEPQEKYNGFILDISGGGMRILTDKELHLRESIICSFDIPEQGTVSVSGKVVRVLRAHDESYSYDIGLSFDDSQDYTQEKIIKYVFDQQRKLRKMGFL